MTPDRERFPEIAARRGELDKCVNCGLCQSVCPTYIVGGYEGLTARGKIILMRGLLDGSMEPSASVADLFDDCLSCYACQSVCPAGVKTEHLWTAAREDLKSLSLRSRVKRTALKLTIGKPPMLDGTVGLISRLIGRESGQPISRGVPLLPRLEEEYKPEAKELGSVALLVGCSSNYLTPDIAQTVIRLLNRAGYRVMVPHKQVCCGAPAINNGAWELARRLARRNIQVFGESQTDWIVSPDGTCAGALRQEYQTLFRDDNEMGVAATNLAAKVIDLSKLLWQSLQSNILNLKELNTAVTIHDSCHITHIGSNQWRSLVGMIPGVRLVEMRDSSHCCGFGGSYMFAHQRSSLEIAGRKLERAIETGAEQMLVGSPGCLLRLRTAKEKLGMDNPKVRHHAEFLMDALA